MCCAQGFLYIISNRCTRMTSNCAQVINYTVINRRGIIRTPIASILRYTQVQGNATSTSPLHCTLNITREDSMKPNPNASCLIIFYKNVSCTASNSVLVSDPTDMCRPCSLRWTGCEDWKYILLDYVALGPYVLVTIHVQDVSVAFSVELEISVSRYPIPHHLRKVSISPTLGVWFACFIM